MEDESLDDILESERQDKLQFEVGQTPLAEDGDTPAARPEEASSQKYTDDHPITDSDLDSTEIYNEGL